MENKEIKDDKKFAVEKIRKMTNMRMASAANKVYKISLDWQEKFH